MLILSNTSKQTLNIGGVTLRPLEIGVKSQFDREALEGHLFVKNGLVTIGNSMVIKPEGPASDEEEGEEEEPLTNEVSDAVTSALEAAKEEARTTEDMDRLVELSEDSRKTVSKIALARIEEMGGV